MLSTIEGLKDDLNSLAGLLNLFRSEAVQVKLLDRFFELVQAPVEAVMPSVTTAQRRGRPPKVKPASVEPLAPKRRGRPPKVKVVAAATEAPKRRGRPPKVQATGKRKKRNAMGATGALNALIEKGYFKRRRTIVDIVQASQSQLGVSIPVTNLSGPLGNFVNAKKLQRAKNKEGRFEYWVN